MMITFGPGNLENDPRVLKYKTLFALRRIISVLFVIITSGLISSIFIVSFLVYSKIARLHDEMHLGDIPPQNKEHNYNNGAGAQHFLQDYM